MPNLKGVWIGVHPDAAMFGIETRKAVQARTAGIKAEIPVTADTKPAIASIEALKTRMRALASRLAELRITAEDKQAEAVIARLQVRLFALTRKASSIKIGADVDTGKLLAAEAALLGLEAAAGKLAPVLGRTDAALGAFSKTVTGNGRGWGILLGNVRLFGGVLGRVLPVALASVAVWHVLADTIVELAAVWIPAGLAVGAFAVAASDAGKEIVNRMTAVHTAMDATGRSIPGLATGMEALHNAVRPQVYQLFGDALTIVRSRTGTFQQVAKATGTVLDQLGARIVAAVTSSNKLGTSTSRLSAFWKTAVTDVAKLGDSIGNLFGVFGNLFKALPGFAAGLLSIGDAFTRILENASAAAVPVLKWVLLLHGYILYSGLAVTATLAFIGGLANLARMFVTFAASSVLAGVGALKTFGSALVSIGLALAAYVESIIVADGASASFAAALAPLAANPMIWVTAAALALGALVIWMIRSKDAAQSFNDTMQQTISNAQLASLQSTLQLAASQTAVKLAGANRDLNKALSEQAPAVTGAATRWSSNYSPAVDHAAQSVRELTAGQKQIADQAALVSGRIGALSKRYGGNTAALGALVAAGITSAQITDKNKDKWAQALIQVDSTTAAYQALGTQAGTLGNDLDVLGRTVTDQYKAVQALNQGWTQFIGDVTGTQGAFDTVAQGFFTLNDHAGKLTFSLGKLKVKYSDQKAAIDSLTPAGIALNQAFGEQVVNLDKLFASWRTAGLAGNLFTSGVKDGIAPLVKYARGSQEATAQLIALAQEAGYQGPISLQALTKWLGNTHGATQKLKDITNTATEQEALLTGAMRAQGTYIANTLINDINNAALAYNGVAGKAAAYGRAVARFGRGSTQANAAQKTLIDSITRTGIASGSTAGQISALAAKVLGIPRSQALAEVNAEILKISHVSPEATKEFGAFATAVGNGDIKSKSAKASALALADELLGLTGNSKTAHAEFVTLAEKIGLTKNKAEALWKQISGSLSPTLAHQADVVLPNARNKFEEWANKGLQLGTTKADILYKKLETQLGPGLDKLSNRNIVNSKAKFDDWAMHSLGLSHDKAEALRKKLVDLQNQINAMHGKNVGVNFVGSGTGSIAFKESIPGVTLGPSSGGLLGFHAAGGMISGGTAGKDSVLGMLMPGEVVVPTNMVRQGAVDHLRGKLPGFAAGGLAGSTGSARFTGLEGPAGVLSSGQHRMALVEKQFGEAVEKHYFAQVLAKFRKDMNALAGGGPAIVSYARSFLGKIPYAFGGTGLSADDCSGFTQAVYGKFGIHAPRTSEAQFAWVTKSSPVPGGLAFYVSPGGGPPPGHVAIVQDRGSVISQGGPQGVKGPKIQPLKFLPLMGTGVPKGGFPRSSGGAGNAAIGGPAAAGPAAAKAYAASQLGRFGWGQAQMKFLDQLWTRESGWNRLARNASSGAYGIPQALPASKMGAAANPPTSSAAAQINWGEGYIRGRYGSPQSAWGHELSWGWYGKGGMIPGMAAGGPVTTKVDPGGPAAVTAYRKLLWKERSHEGFDYLGLRHAFAAGPAKYRTKLTMSEMKTLDRRQGATQLAYTHLTGAGLTKAHLNTLGAAARAEARTASDKALNRTPGGHPGWAKGLRYWLGQMSATAGKGLPGGQLTSGPGGAGLPQITHTYGGDVGVFNSIAPVLAKALQPFRAGGMAGFARGGMVPSFDKGGTLSPGYNTVWNGLGRDEKLVPAGSNITVTLEIAPGGNTAFEQLLHSAIRKHVRTRGGGSVQRAYSTPGTVSGSNTWRSG